MAEENNKFYGNKQFYFCGELKSDENLFKTTEGKKYLRLNLPLYDGESTVYCESFTFGIQDFVYGSVSGKWTKTPWQERNSSKVLKGMRFGDKFNYEGHEFSNNYDLIDAFKRDIEEGKIKKGDKLNVNGVVEYQFYNDEVQKHFVIKSIKKAEPTDKPHLTLVTEVLVEPNAVKEVEDGLEIDVLMLEYMKLDRESKKYPRLIPEKLVYNTDNKIVKKLMLDKLNIKEGYVAACFEINLFRSAKEVTVQPLSENQKLYVELGFITEEDALKENTLIDDTISEELIVVKPVVKKQFKDIVFTPNQEQTKEFLKDLNPKVDTMFDVFGSSNIDDADLDNFFNEDSLPF